MPIMRHQGALCSSDQAVTESNENKGRMENRDYSMICYFTRKLFVDILKRKIIYIKHFRHHSNRCTDTLNQISKSQNSYIY